MQKKIIALAVAGLVSGGAFAQANVTVSGNIGISYDSYNLNGATAARTTFRQNLVADQSSAVILKGEESLDGGLTAWFQIDSRLTMDRGNGGVNNWSSGLQTSGLGNGNTAIGFNGNLGSIGFGRWDVHYDAFAPIGDVVTAGALASRIGYFGVMAQVNGGQIALGSRAANLVWFDSPTWNGLRARVGFSTNPAAGEGEATLGLAAGGGDPGNGNAWQLRVNYDNGPWNAVWSYFKYQVEGRGDYVAAAWTLPATGGISTTPGSGAGVLGNGLNDPRDQVSNRLGMAYTFPMGVKVGIGWDRSTIKRNTATAANAATGAAAITAGDMTRTAWMLPISYTTGNHTMGLTYARAGNTSNVVGSSEAKEYLVHYGYNFSKRTGVGVQYVNLKNTTAGLYSVHGASNANTGYTGPISGEDTSLLSVNIRHFF